MPAPGGRHGRPEPEFGAPAEADNEFPPGEPRLLSGRTPHRTDRPVPSEAPTELIMPVSERPTEVINLEDYRDQYDDYLDDGYDDEYDDDDYDEDEKPKDKVSQFAKLAGELLLTGGMVVLLFVIYEVWITDLISAGRQADATAALDQDWNHEGDSGTVGGGRTEHISAVDGQGIAKLYIPSLGEDYKFTVIEGTTDNDLAIGPGHYTDTQMPGEPGNFAVAGHRVGKGAPFNDLDLVEPCDSIVVETRDDWFVYRMLPVEGEGNDWQSNPMCNGANGEQKVQPLTGPYAKTTGRTIVDPSQGEVVDAVPSQPDSAVPVAQRKQLLTLTTCHPKFSDAQRMILHAVLVKKWPKAELGGKVPAELKETS